MFQVSCWLAFVIRFPLVLIQALNVVWSKCYGFQQQLAFEVAPNCQPLWYGCSVQSQKYKTVQKLHKIAHVTVTARRLHKFKS